MHSEERRVPKAKRKTKIDPAVGRGPRAWNSIRWRVILLFLVLSVMAFFMAGLLVSHIVESNLLSQRVAQRMQQVGDFSVRITEDLQRQEAAALYQKAIEKGREFTGRVLITDGYGVVQIDSFASLTGARLEHREVAALLQGERDAAYGYHRLQDSSGKHFWAAYYTSAVIADSRPVGVVMFAEDISDIVSEVNGIRLRFIFIFAGATLIVLVFSTLFMNHISRPLTELRETAIKISRGNFAARVQVKGSDELADTGRVFNAMADRLENIDQQRSEFVSNASHELKTPLASMKILVESLLYQEGIPEDVYKDFLGDINQEVDRLTNLINDLLLMTKIENDKGNLELAPASLEQLIRQVMDSLEPIASQKGVSLTLAEGEDIRLVCDAMRIQQAVSNLVDNGIKYTAGGGSVTVSLEDGESEVAIVVADTGDGIDEADRQKIFERFYRVDKARSRETGGTGLGLYIVRRIALLHGGRVDLESEKGKGSVFRLHLPKPAAPSRKEDSQDEG